jgi:hypothetical protein
MKNNASEIKNTCRINSLIISGSAKNFVFILYPMETIYVCNQCVEEGCWFKKVWITSGRLARL